MGTVVDILNLLGITHDKYPFLVLGVLILVVGGAISFLIWIKTSGINKVLEKIKLNITAITTFLVSKHRFNPNLIKDMSPLTIQPEGIKVLEQSGFMSIFESNKSIFYGFIEPLKPTTRLDVEVYSIMAFTVLLEKDFMAPIKTFLYDNPKTRDSFNGLAGIYIRDKYLEDHPDITQ